MYTLSKFVICCGVYLVIGCTAKPPTPLTYLALEKPTGKIVSSDFTLKDSHSRGGFYFLNAGFRPAPDVASYLKQAHDESKMSVLKNADVELRIPFAFDILMFGYNKSTDEVRVGNPQE